MSKDWYKSRTLWIAVVTGIIGIVGAFGVAIPEWVIQVLVAMGLYTARTAKEEIK
jgi:hypothetical protein